MKTLSQLIRRTSSLGLAALLAVCMVAGCNSGPLNKLTQANLDQVQPGMTSAQVKEILGDPTSTKDEPIPIVGGTKTTYTYDSGNTHIVIVLKNDTVQTKEGSFGSGQ